MLTDDKKTILVVEDELPIVEIITIILEFEGYHVLTAGNGEEALACLEKSHVDLVLSDVMMPIIDGIELCKWIAASDAHSSVPVVLMSAVHRHAQIDGCKRAAFIKKPFGIDNLITVVTSVLGE